MSARHWQLYGLDIENPDSLRFSVLWRQILVVTKWPAKFQAFIMWLAVATQVVLDAGKYLE